MFDLPFSTTLLVFGFPAFWEQDAPDEEDRP